MAVLMPSAGHGPGKETIPTSPVYCNATPLWRAVDRVRIWVPCSIECHV